MNAYITNKIQFVIKTIERESSQFFIVVLLPYSCTFTLSFKLSFSYCVAALNSGVIGLLAIVEYCAFLRDGHYVFWRSRLNIRYWNYYIVDSDGECRPVSPISAMRKYAVISSIKNHFLNNKVNIDKKVCKESARIFDLRIGRCHN